MKRHFLSRLGIGLVFAGMALSFAPAAFAKPGAAVHVKGKMPFGYEYAKALEAARADGKPILAYFTYDG